MAFFSKNDFAALTKKIQGNEYQGPAELEKLLTDLAAVEDFDAGKLGWMLAHGNRRLRSFAIEKMAPLVEKLGFETFLKEIEGKPAVVRQDVAKIISKVKPSLLAVRLNHWLKSKDAEVREGALDVIAAHSECLEFLGIIKAALRDEVPKIRHAASRLLVPFIENQTVAFMFRELVRDDDPIVRQIAIEALAEKPNVDIVDCFFERLPHESAPLRAVLVRALSVLARKQEGKIEDRLLPILADENPDMREAAGRLLSEMPDQAKVLRAFLVHSRGLASWLRDRSTKSILESVAKVGDALVKLVEDEDEDVRVSAVLMLGQLRDERVLPHAKSLFLGTADWWVRGMGADVLALFPGKDTVSTLLERLADDELRYAVVAVLGKVVDTESEKALLSCLDDPSRGIRGQAIESLIRHDNPHVTARLMKLAVEDPEFPIRERAVAALMRMTSADQSAVSTLDTGKGLNRDDSVSAPIDLGMENDSLNRALTTNRT